MALQWDTRTPEPCPLKIIRVYAQAHYQSDGSCRCNNRNCDQLGCDYPKEPQQIYCVKHLRDYGPVYTGKQCLECASLIEESRFCRGCERCLGTCCTCNTFGCSSCMETYDLENTSQCDNCEYCEDCCECISCESCGEKTAIENVCSACNNGDCDACSCCDCDICQNCDAKVTSDNFICSYCERCESCCECVRCDSCEENVRSVCSPHGECDSCCETCEVF